MGIYSKAGDHVSNALKVLIGIKAKKMKIMSFPDDAIKYSIKQTSSGNRLK